MLLNLLQKHCHRKKFLFLKQKRREKKRLVLGILVRMSTSLPEFYSQGQGHWLPSQVLQGHPWRALGVTSRTPSYLTDWTPFLSEPT